MILCDVNVLLGAMVERSPHHAVCRGELERLRSRPREMAISELILAAVVRIGSNPRVFQPTPTPAEVFGFVEALTSQAEVRRVEPGPRHWFIFRSLVLETGIHGSDTTDAYLAALAMEHGCEWWTTDGGFSRFPGSAGATSLRARPNEAPAHSSSPPREYTASWGPRLFSTWRMRPAAAMRRSAVATVRDWAGRRRRLP